MTWDEIRLVWESKATVYTSRPSINQSAIPPSSRPRTQARPDPTNVSPARKTAKSAPFPESAAAADVEEEEGGWS